MSNGAVSSAPRPMILVLAAIVVVAAVGCGEEPAEPPTPQSPASPAAPEAPSGTAAEPQAPKTPRPANTPLPPRAASKPPTPTATPTPDRVITIGHWGDQFPVLHDSQVVTAPGQMRDTMAPWRDGGGNRLFSTHVFGTPFMLNEKGEARPWIATAITSNEDLTVWTMKLREDAVFQDGTPITAADFKAYWEHGAKPESRVVWGGASLTLGEIKGWGPLRAGEAAEAVGLRVVDDHTLKIEIENPNAAWPLYMATWHIGISKLEQILADESWGNAPIGAGPFRLTYDPDSGLTELVNVYLVVKNGDLVVRQNTDDAYDASGFAGAAIIDKLVLPNIPDEQARLIMFESGELDLMRVGRETYAALDPGHPFNPLLYASPSGGLSFILLQIDKAPVHDLMIRRALAHGQDMEKIVGAIWGSAATHAKGLISSLLPCHDPAANYQPYDPDLARQILFGSTYSHVARLPSLMVDLHRPDTISMGAAMRQYWKNNLGAELDILKRESGLPRRETSQLYRHRMDSRVPDSTQIVSNLARGYFVETLPGLPLQRRTGSDYLDALADLARSVPLDHPDRCTVFQAFEEEYFDKAYMIPIREVDPVRWVVQPWLGGFESSFNQDFNTLMTAYVERH